MGGGGGRRGGKGKGREGKERGEGGGSPNVVVGEGGVEHLEVGVVDVLEHQTGRLALWVSHDVQQLDDVSPAAQILQDLDLPAQQRNRAAAAAAAVGAGIVSGALHTCVHIHTIHAINHLFCVLLIEHISNLQRVPGGCG